MRVLVVLVMAAIAGCAVDYTTVSVDEFAKYQTVEKSDFEKTVKIDGGPMRLELPGGFLDVGNVQARIRGWIDENDAVGQAHQLYLNIHYSTPGSWRYYRRATFRGGDEAKVTKISSEVNFCQSTRCDYTEVIGVSLPIDALLLGETIEVQVSAKSGHKVIISIPENYVIAYSQLIAENSP